MNGNQKDQHGHQGQDPQPQHGKDDKGHNEDRGIVTKPGKSHALTQ